MPRYTQGVRGEGRVNIGPPQANFKTLVNGNAIKLEIRGPPWHFFLKALTPPTVVRNLKFGAKQVF